jgi:hypothetical protein
VLLLAVPIILILPRYETVDSNTGANSVEPPKSWKAVDLHPWLVYQISDILSTEAPGTAVDLFDNGFDRYVP